MARYKIKVNGKKWPEQLDFFKERSHSHVVQEKEDVKEAKSETFFEDCAIHSSIECAPSADEGWI